MMQTEGMTKKTAKKTAKKAAQNVPKAGIRIKVVLPGCSIGPGKIRLLELIGEKGSISAAARELGMSYRRAWHLIETLNQGLKSPVVETSVGGTRGGGAGLSKSGRALVKSFQALAGAAEKKSEKAMAEIKRLAK